MLASRIDEPSAGAGAMHAARVPGTLHALLAALDGAERSRVVTARRGSAR